MKQILIFIALVCSMIFSYIIYSLLKKIFGISNRILYFAKGSIENKNFFRKYILTKHMWLRSMGVSYMLKKDMSVYSFVFLRIIFALVSAAIASLYFNDFLNLFNVLSILFCGILGGTLPVIFIKMSNNMDNNMMLEDIKIMYDTLKIQSKAGVYIVDILTECYMLVKTQRLKTALREFSNHIYTKHDLSKGLMIFNSKFNNIYIDMLVMTIEQSLKSGQTIQMFDDIARQIRQVEYALYEKEKRRSENKMLAYQLAVYFAILIVVVYAMFMQLIKAFVF